MIPTYGISPSNIYDFSWHYFVNLTLLLCWGYFIVFCPRRWNPGYDPTNVTSCGYIYTIINKHGRSYKRLTKHINGRTHSHRRHANRQPYTSRHARSICNSNTTTNLYTYHYPNLNTYTHTNPITYSHINPNSHTNSCCNQYAYTDLAANSNKRANCNRNTYNRDPTDQHLGSDLCGSDPYPNINTNTNGNTSPINPGLS